MIVQLCAGVSYRWPKTNTGATKQCGGISQELEKLAALKKLAEVHIRKNKKQADHISTGLVAEAARRSNLGSHYSYPDSP